MKVSVKAIVVMVCMMAALLVVGAWAQEDEPPATPEEVVKRLQPLLFGTQGMRHERLAVLLSENSRQALEDWDDLFAALFVSVAWPQLQAQEAKIERQTATVEVVPGLRAMQVKLVKEDAQWKVDLLSSLRSLVEPLAQETGPASPQEVVKRFGELLISVAVAEMRVPRGIVEPLEAALDGVLSEDSQEALQESRRELLGPLCGVLSSWQTFSSFHFLQTRKADTDDDAATVPTMLQPRPLSVKLVKEDGQWKIDLVATVEGLPEPFRQAFTKAKDQALLTSCLSNIKQIALALVMYAQDHDDHLPLTEQWMDEIAPYTRNEQILRCPAAPELEYGYAFNARLSGANMRDIAEPSRIVIIFDSNLGTRNAAGEPETVAAPPRHNDGNNYGFVDGHAKWGREVPDFGPEGRAVAAVAGDLAQGEMPFERIIEEHDAQQLREYAENRLNLPGG